jgi:O-antigen/teichoic acid export membrane protein
MTLLVSVIAHEGFRFDAVTMAWATALTGFSPAWYGIGAGKPRILAIYDTVPRFLAAVVSAPLIIVTGDVWLYGAVSIVTTTAALAAFHRRFGEAASWIPRNPVKVVREILPSTGVAAISFSGSAYASSPVPIATATVQSASATAGFSSADNIYRLGLFSIVAVGNTFQGWTLEPSASNPRCRHLIAVYAHLLLGVLGGAFLTILGPWVSGLIFGEALRADTLTSFFYGLSFFFLSASTPFIRNVLIPAGRQRTVLIWTALSAVCGIVLMVSAGLSGNVSGVALGMAVSEAVLLAGLLLPALALLPASARRANGEG